MAQRHYISIISQLPYGKWRCLDWSLITSAECFPSNDIVAVCNLFLSGLLAIARSTLVLDAGRPITYKEPWKVLCSTEKTAWKLERTGNQYGSLEAGYLAGKLGSTLSQE